MELTLDNLDFTLDNMDSVVPRARHCGIPAILPPMSLKNAPARA